MLHHCYILQCSCSLKETLSENRFILSGSKKTHKNCFFWTAKRLNREQIQEFSFSCFSQEGNNPSNLKQVSSWVLEEISMSETVLRFAKKLKSAIKVWVLIWTHIHFSSKLSEKYMKEIWEAMKEQLMRNKIFLWVSLPLEYTVCLHLSQIHDKTGVFTA